MPIDKDLPYYPAIPLLGVYSKKYKPGYNRTTRTPMFIAALVIITKVWIYPRCLTTDEVLLSQKEE
jgi:hypothetical protein